MIRARALVLGLRVASRQGLRDFWRSLAESKKFGGALVFSLVAAIGVETVSVMRSVGVV